MSREFLIIKGDYNYLVDVETNMGYSFSTFGQSIEKVNARYALSLGGGIREVDILSILSEGVRAECELYLGGEKLFVREKGMNVYTKLSKNLPRVSFIPYRVTRPEMVGLVQILIPLEKYRVTISTVKDLLK